MTMKLKKIKVVRPEVECTITRPVLGRVLFPFYVVHACWIVRKTFINKIQLTLCGKTVGSFWLVSVPKFKAVDDG